MNPSNSLSPEPCAQAPLCPACGSPVIRIAASVEVKYRVHYAQTIKELEVIEEQFGEGEWTEQSPAACTDCDWRGAVAELLERR